MDSDTHRSEHLTRAPSVAYVARNFPPALFSVSAGMDIKAYILGSAL
jgi:hypothetical protein